DVYKRQTSHNTILAAYSAIPATVTQAYIIELTADYTGTEETYPLIFGLKEGTSAANSITIRPAAGVTTVTNSGSSTAGLFALDDADFLIFDGRAGGVGSTYNWIIENLASTGTNSHTFWLLNGATNNSLRYLHIKNNTQSTSGPRAIFFGVSTANVSGNSNNLISKNKIEGGRSGIALSGTAANPNTDNIIEYNEIFGWGFAGIWTLAASGNLIIDANHIYMTQGYAVTNPAGLNLGSGLTSITITRNKIHTILSSSATGITPRGITVTAAANAVYNIYNNFVSLTSTLTGAITSYYGVSVSGTSAHTFNFHYNSINIGGTHTGGTANAVVSSGFVKTASSVDLTLNMKNNIMINTRTGGATGVFHTGYFINNILGTINADYNVGHASGDPNSFHAGWGTTIYNDLAQYKTAAMPNEQNTIFKTVEFVSPTDLHLTGSSIGDADLTGTPIAEVLIDIDGQQRSTTHPYRGADEAETEIPVELTSFAASVIDRDVTLTWSTATEKNNNGFEIQRSNDNINFATISFVKGAGTTLEASTYSFTDNNLNAGKYQYRLKQIDYDGSFTYYNLSEEVQVGTPVDFSISQNYPNPFNPSTKVDFSLPIESNVTVELFDILGSKVATLISGSFVSGFHSFEISTQKYGLSSGNYIYRMSARDSQGNEVFNQLRKMTLLK
ncbi:MAG: T9SS type A sorting domain-containing protein, partial [Ignavibacteriaceae bacterium]|nr:T9SS type A sorting domain-containing protein [Ignavibacteriaceae bacterium]